MVLQSLIFKMDRPELKIMIPPSTEISVSRSLVRNPLSAPAPK